MAISWTADTLCQSLTHFDWTLSKPCTSKQWQAYLETYQLTQLPNDARHFAGTLNLPDSETIVIQAWQPKVITGTAFIVHGLYDHLGLYHHLIRYCLNRGWRVVAFDLPGHGLSSGKRTSIRDFQQYDRIFTKILSSICVFFKEPLHVFGQSTGGAIVINYLLKYGIKPQFSPFASINLIAPLVRPKEWRKIICFYWLLKRCKHTMKRGRSINSQDTEFLDFLWHHDPLQAGELSVDWIGALIEWDHFIHAQNPSKVPINIIQGDDDNSVSWRYNLKFLEQYFPNQQLQMITSGRHHLVNEIAHIREQIWEFFDSQIIDTAF